jgi:hypothetical protein
VKPSIEHNRNGRTIEFQQVIKSMVNPLNITRAITFQCIPGSQKHCSFDKKSEPYFQTFQAAIQPQVSSVVFDTRNRRFKSQLHDNSKPKGSLIYFIPRLIEGVTYERKNRPRPQDHLPASALDITIHHKISIVSEKQINKLLGFRHLQQIGDANQIAL